MSGYTPPPHAGSENPFDQFDPVINEERRNNDAYHPPPAVNTHASPTEPNYYPPSEPEQPPYYSHSTSAATNDPSPPNPSQPDWLNEDEGLGKEPHNTAADDNDDRPGWLAEEDDRRSNGHHQNGTENPSRPTTMNNNNVHEASAPNNYATTHVPTRDAGSVNGPPRPVQPTQPPTRPTTAAAAAAADDDDDDDDLEEIDLEDDGRARDYWGRKRRKCCDCLWQCCFECCMGFTKPPSCEFQKFCACPHGWCYTTMGIVLAFFGLVLTFMVLRTCEFETIVLLQNGQPATGAVKRGYGMLAREISFDEVADWSNCLVYPDDERGIIDGWWKASEFFTYLSGIMGFLGFMILLGTICVACSPNMFEHWLVWNYILAAIFSAFGYLLFGAKMCTDNDCRLGQGGVQVISTFLFWLSCANTVKSWPQANPPDQEEDDFDDLYYERPEDKYADPRERAVMNQYFGEDEDQRTHDSRRMQAYDENGNPVQQRYDNYGNPVYPERPYYDDKRHDDDASYYSGRAPGSYRGGPAGSYRGRDAGSYAGSRRSRAQDDAYSHADSSYRGDADSYAASLPGIHGDASYRSQDQRPGAYYRPDDLLDQPGALGGRPGGYADYGDDEDDDYLGGGAGYTDPDDGYMGGAARDDYRDPYRQGSGDSYRQAPGDPKRQISTDSYGQGPGDPYGLYSGESYRQAPGDPHRQSSGDSYRQATGDPYRQSSGDLYSQGSGPSQHYSTPETYQPEAAGNLGVGYNDDDNDYNNAQSTIHHGDDQHVRTDDSRTSRTASPPEYGGYSHGRQPNVHDDDDDEGPTIT